MKKKYKRLIALALSTTTILSAMCHSVYADNKSTTNTTQNNNAISDVSESEYEVMAYTGEAITPDVSLYDNSKQLENEVDYDLSYENNVNVGEATITVTFKGNYQGTRTVTCELLGYK